ncbi:peptidoglycan recognition family protein [Paenibacillus illinoisensis]|uniref:peptidoglycan recognition protein family protein n=1 Tax=Paenibacillus illinoisensis TaxID=59845 RepID=UPI0030195D9B
MAKYSFVMKYEITTQYLTTHTKRRPGRLINKVGFVVAHDTGNPNSTATGNVNYYENSRNLESASAHIFVDDKHIIECIPAGLVGNKYAEKAWHVLYNVPTDNILFGEDANDAAIGIEYCYGTNINAREAYKRYVWVLAYTCFKYNLDPVKKITGHFILDPNRKTDPKSGLKASLGTTFEQLVKDVVTEYNACLVETDDENLTPEEEKMVKELQAQVAKMQKELDALKTKDAMKEIPSWAKASVDKAVEKGFVAKENATGGSYDFYRIITVLDRAGKL